MTCECYRVAGWSSSVARRAHNPKVVGSNPAPATKGKTSFKRMRFFLWREINLFEICEMCFARKRTTFGCCEMPAGVRRFISFHIAAKTQYITMHSTLVCEALFHILRQQNISPKLFPSVRIYLSKTQIHLFRTPLP